MKGHWHCKYELTYHLVLVVKYRRKCINHEVMETLNEEINRILELWECKLEEFNGESDHIHVLFQAHPSLELSKLINNLKTVSSRMVRKKHGDHLKKFLWKDAFWTRAYYISTTGGANIETIRKYIEKQGEN